MGLRVVTILLVAFFYLQPCHAQYARPICAAIFAKEQKTTQGLRLKEKKSFTFGSLNLFNWKTKSDAARNRLLDRLRDGPFKTPDEITKTRRLFKEVNADVWSLQEIVGGGEGLADLIHKTLDDEYDGYLVHGNDEGIDIGFVVKKSLDVDVVIVSQSDLKFTNGRGQLRKVFVRDLPVLFLRQRDGRKVSPNVEPDLIVIGGHLTAGSSELDRIRRNEESEYVDHTMESLEKRFPGVKIVMGADFNTDLINHQDEIKPILKRLMDNIKLMGPRIPDEYKLTFKNSKGYLIAQLDTVMTNLAMAKCLVKAFVFRSRNNTSDHEPVVAIYDMTRP